VSRTQRRTGMDVQRIQKKFKIGKLGRLKKHLGIWYKWKNDKITKELYLETLSNTRRQQEKK
jgi:hypothetical protein